jgi:hypothetical protein
MPTLNELRKRVAKLEAGTTGSVVSFTMTDRTIRRMRAKHVLEACREAILGNRSAEVETLLTSVGNTASHSLVDLLRMCID